MENDIRELLAKMGAEESSIEVTPGELLFRGTKVPAYVFSVEITRGKPLRIRIPLGLDADEAARWIKGEIMNPAAARSGELAPGS